MVNWKPFPLKQTVTFGAHNITSDGLILTAQVPFKEVNIARNTVHDACYNISSFSRNNQST